VPLIAWRIAESNEEDLVPPRLKGRREAVEPQQSARPPDIVAGHEEAHLT
jgi:hypothetical protein